MFQILIVDDHEHLVESLAKSIPWEELNIGQVYKAFSGKEALQVLDTYPIEIVITDIRMPGMSGLELIERIRQKRKRIKCILLSGYSDFEYAKQAILYHTADYILKPADDEEIIACLQRVTESINKEWEEISSHQRTLYTLKENFPKLRDGLLNELLQGRSFPPAVLEQQLESFEIPFAAGDGVTLMIVRMDESFYTYNRRDFHLMEYAIGNMAEEIFQDDYMLWTCRDPHDYLIFLIKEKAEPHDHPHAGHTSTPLRPLKLEREASELQNSVGAFLHGRISILISNKGLFPQDIPKLYQSSLSLVRQRFGRNEEFLISAGSFSDSLPVDSSIGLYDSPTLVQLLESGRWDAIEEKLQTVFQIHDPDNGQPSQEHIMEIYFAVGSALIHLSHKNGKRLEDIIGEDFGLLLQPVPFRNIDQLQVWVSRVLEKVKADMNSEQGETSAFLVRRAQEYVESHLSGDTSLQAVADFVYVHPVYLSRIYKFETGEGLSAYILRLKMIKAEKLLLESNKKVHEIAEELGYDNPPYFIKVFKKHSGLTPKEFRDQRTG
ncbi:hypothetical protein B1748_12120 [Paenibacillus sp. MY03]|uniref:response regulator n=1 Tax=Paenibacillus sp. MY03 TaxID=302980 RepID=UPI000B3C1998|nr:response regulator [Paenibacillus sp. MY03]OUS76423.1 hypothetical protein B1748_12120 [Paenibacillus sp. MY03]